MSASKIFYPILKRYSVPFYFSHHIIEADASKLSRLPHRNFSFSIPPDRPFYKFRLQTVLDDPGKQRRSANVEFLCKFIDDSGGTFVKLGFYDF